VKHKKK